MIHLLFFLSYIFSPHLLKGSLLASYLLLLNSRLTREQILGSGFGVGLFFDLTSLSLPFGTYTLACTLLSYLIHRSARMLHLEKLFSFALYSYLSSFLLVILIICTSSILGNAPTITSRFVFTDLIICPLLDMLYSAAVLYLLPRALPLLRRYDILLAFFKKRGTTKENTP